MNRWAAEAWILQSHTAGQMSMQRRHGEWQSVFWSISTSLANNPFGFIEASFACYLMIMLQPTGCSGASASAVTLLSTIHLLLLRFLKKLLLLLLCWQCGSNQQSTCTMARQKIRISPCISCLDFSTEVEHLEFLICGKKKNHISFQQPCSVQKSSTVPLSVVLRSSEKFYYL